MTHCFCTSFLLFACSMPTLRPVPWTPRSERVDCRADAVRPVEAVAGFLFLEAESFIDYGSWRLDTQFVHKMGSAYLIAPGVGAPIGAATTTVDIPRKGVWFAWVRTKDWLPEFSPGRFVLSVGGMRGLTLGASKRVGWLWEKAGSFDLERGETSLALEDLSGAFARCDAIILTTDAAYVPPDDAEGLRQERLHLTGKSDVVIDEGEYDVVVVGAGPGGFNAAIAAARGETKVALVGDRPVLGGNASDEIGVNMCGASVNKPSVRETGLAEEAMCVRTRRPGPGMSNSYQAMADAEKNLRIFKNHRMVEAKTKNGSIVSVGCCHTLTGARSALRGKLFVDATGDGWLGYFAGAEYREGREGQKEFNEASAPESPDTLTMSGLLHEPTIGVCYRAEEVSEPDNFVTPEWADVLPRGFTRKIYGLRGEWWVEHSGFFDDCADPERARDELIRISFAYWGWLKNKSDRRTEAAMWKLKEIPVLTGRRESRRLVGDYILTANDCETARVFDDAVAYGGWPLDTHDPLGMSAPESDGYWLRHPDVPVYTIPYRSLYSTNVVNLFMAGRDISASHIAFGSSRVQQTCAAVGQAVGTAAAMCLKSGLLPREFGQHHIRDLQQQLIKDDAWIPGFANEDLSDVARAATVTASSCAAEFVRFSPNAKGFCRGADISFGDISPTNVIDGVTRPLGTAAHAWISAAEQSLPQWLRLDFPKEEFIGEIRLTFDTNLELIAKPRPPDSMLVRGYVLEGCGSDEVWFELAREDDNYLRQRIHRFSPRLLKAIRLTVTNTYGASQAAVFEVRAYAGKLSGR